MRVLAIDTSTAAVSVALADEQGLQAQMELGAGRQASEALLPLTETLLSLNGLTLAKLDALAVTSGPGSFTGLRIGLATVKAWTQALAKPLIAVSTLQALAYNAAESGRLVCPLLNAQRGELYAALFNADGQRLLPDMIISPPALAARLKAETLPIVFCGAGLTEASASLTSLLGEQMLLAPLQRQASIAAATALLALDKYRAGESADPILLEPQYLRRCAAEEQLQEDAQHGGA